MAARKSVNRQYTLIAELTLGITDITNDCSIILPPGAMLLSTGMNVVTVFNGTTNTLTVTDGTTTFLSAVDLKTAAVTAGSTSVKYYPSGATIQVNLAQTGTATAGEAYAWATYYIVGRGNEVQQ